MCLGCLQHANNSHIVQIRSYEWIGFARQPLLLSVTVKQFRGSVQSTIRSQTVNTSESLCPCAMHLHYARRALLCSHCRTSRCLLEAPAGTATQASARPAPQSCGLARMTCLLPHTCICPWHSSTSILLVLDVVPASLIAHSCPLLMSQKHAAQNSA